MKSILLIGLGRFGRHIAIKLHELRHQVMAVDWREECVEAALPYVTSAQIGDSKNEEFMASLGVAISMCASWLSETIFKARWKPPRC